MTKTYLESWLHWKRPDAKVLKMDQLGVLRTIMLFQSDRIKGRPWSVVINRPGIWFKAYRTREKAEQAYRDKIRAVAADVAVEALTRR